MTTSNIVNTTPNYSITGQNGVMSYNYSSGVTIGPNVNHNPLFTINGNSNDLVLSEKASLVVKGNVVINGQDLEERLKVIERMLMIPERDLEIESKYPKLKEKLDEILMCPERDVIINENYVKIKSLYVDYNTTLEKYRTWERIKESK